MFVRTLFWGPSPKCRCFVGIVAPVGLERLRQMFGADDAGGAGGEDDDSDFIEDDAEGEPTQFEKIKKIGQSMST